MLQKKMLLVLTIIVSLWAGKYNSAVKAFESHPGYVEPIATILGTFGGSGWNQSSSIPQGFSGSFSIPITISVINDKDRSYSGTYVDSVLLGSAEQQDVIDESAYQDYTAPTVFGTSPAPTLTSYVLNDNNLISSTKPVYLSDGIADMAAFNWMPLPMLQTEFSYMYTSLKLRYLGRPNKELSIHYPGAAIQHDLRSLLPKLPVNITLFGNFAMPILNWTPGEGIEGTMELRGFSTFTGATVGHLFKRSNLDLFMEIGWEYSRLNTGGALYISEDDEWVRPDMTLIGRNRIRCSFTLAFTPGKWYRLSGSAGIGAQSALTVTPLGVRFGNHEKNKISEDK